MPQPEVPLPLMPAPHCCLAVHDGRPLGLVTCAAAYHPPGALHLCGCCGLPHVGPGPFWERSELASQAFAAQPMPILRPQILTCRNFMLSPCFGGCRLCQGGMVANPLCTEAAMPVAGRTDLQVVVATHRNHELVAVIGLQHHMGNHLHQRSAHLLRSPQRRRVKDCQQTNPTWPMGRGSGKSRAAPLAAGGGGGLVGSRLCSAAQRTVVAGM